MGADKIIAGAAAVATATVSLFPNGMIDAEARVETPHKKELKEMVSILNISWSSNTKLSNNRSVMPLDVLGRTRATLKGSACPSLSERSG